MAREIDFLTQVWVVQMRDEAPIYGVFTNEAKAREACKECNERYGGDYFSCYRFTVQ